MNPDSLVCQHEVCNQFYKKKSTFKNPNSTIQHEKKNYLHLKCSKNCKCCIFYQKKKKKLSNPKKLKKE